MVGKVYSKKIKTAIIGPLIKTWGFFKTFFNPSGKPASMHSTIKENNASLLVSQPDKCRV